MKKKNMALALSLIMVAGSLVACGKKGGDKSSVPASTSEIHTHSYGAWEDTKPATHTAEGEQTRTCACGEKETRTVAKTSEHEYGEWTVTKPATHTEEGEETRTCACGDKDTRPVAKTTEHEFGDWKVTKPATHTEEGEETRTCACGEKETRTVANIADHEWSEWQTVKAATCTVAGEEKRTCACGAKETRPVAATGEHQYGDWSVLSAATCETAGTEHRTCKVCGNEETRDGAVALGHEASTEWSSDDTNHWHACTHDASHKLDEAAHVYDRNVINEETKFSEATPFVMAGYHKSCVCGKISTATSGSEVCYSGERVPLTSYSWEIEPTVSNYGMIKLTFDGFDDVVTFIPELGNETFWKAETVSTEGGSNVAYSYIGKNASLAVVTDWVNSVWDETKVSGMKFKTQLIGLLRANSSMNTIKYSMFDHTEHIYNDYTGNCKFCDESNAEIITIGTQTVIESGFEGDKVICKFENTSDLDTSIYLVNNGVADCYISGVFDENGKEIDLGDRNVFKASATSSCYYIDIDNRGSGSTFEILVEQHDTDALFAVQSKMSISSSSSAGVNLSLTGTVLQGTITVGDVLHYFDGTNTRDLTVVALESGRKTVTSVSEGDAAGIGIQTDLTKEDFAVGAQITSFKQHTTTSLHVNSYMLTKEEGGRHTPVMSGYRPQAYAIYNKSALADVTATMAFTGDTELYKPGESHIIDLTLATPVTEIFAPYFNCLKETGKTVAEIAMVSEDYVDGQFEFHKHVIDTVDGTIIEDSYWVDTSDDTVTTKMSIDGDWYNLQDYLDHETYSHYSWYYRADATKDFTTITGRGIIVFPQTTTGKIFKGEITSEAFWALIDKKAEVTFQTTVDGETTTEVREALITGVTTGSSSDTEHSGMPGFSLRGVELAEAANIVKITVA